jgi:hypothetical protein
MTRLTKILIASTALLILPMNLAFADGSNSAPAPQSNILNGQLDFHVTNATLDTNVTGAAGNVSAASVAGGNAVDITTMSNTNVDNSQYVTSVDISANQSANVHNVNGEVDLQSQAVCNSASISMDPTSTNVASKQECDAVDPSASVTANVANIGNDVSISSTAVGNTFEEDTNAKYGNVATQQLNQSNMYSTVNANVANVAGNVSLTSTAIGNTAQIVHY